MDGFSSMNLRSSRRRTERTAGSWLMKSQLVLACSLGLPFIVSAEPLNIVAFGDSTTAPRTAVVNYAEVLSRHFGRAVDITNKGVSGDTTAKAAGRFQHDVLDEKPDVLIVQFGINDSVIDVWRTPPRTEPRVTRRDYAANLRRFVREAKAGGAEVILMTPNQLRWTPKLVERYGTPPYDPEDERGFNLLLTDYVKAVRSVARREGAVLVDVFAIYDTWEKQNGQSCSRLLLDGMHPNSTGQALVACALKEEIRKILAGHGS